MLYPYVYLLVRAALRDQAAGAYHAARVLGATPGEAARRIVLPLVRPAIAAGAAVVMMETLTDFATVQYFGVDTVTVGVFRIWRGTYDRDAASELATLVLGFALLAIGLERVARAAGPFRRGRRQRRQASSPAGCGDGERPPQRPAALRRCSSRSSVPWAVWWRGRSPSRPVSGARRSLAQYPQYLAHSLQLVAITVVVVLVVSRRGGQRAALRCARDRPASPPGWRSFGYAVPGPVVGHGRVARRRGRRLLSSNRSARICPGPPPPDRCSCCATPTSCASSRPVSVRWRAGIGQVPEEMTASARTLGAGPLRVMGRIHLPLARASLLAGALLVGVDALKELPIVLLLRPFGFDTLPVWVYDLAAESRFQQAALPALSIVAVAVLPVLLLSRQLEQAT